ncbi:arsenate reductase [Mesorhizobium sp. Root157]|uniref:arsenate reductase (glutaredoxin) n=1 Tax=Mesorhizobium sp. Root157 TaxID=1736477 RepID=UPI0006F79B24|nr:arsenate reductase (glutaredoxin) [Mesorhizobium sp. Root157]KQZ94055.1 arsenate reductase [Mesorhizobium sp. Root157]
MSVTIYHNPACGTSRNTLAMIRASGEEPEVIEYLETPPSRQRLLELLDLLRMRPRDLLRMRPRDLLRKKGTPNAELGLDDPKWSDDEIVDLMIANPILIERPIVITDKGAVLARPSEKVLYILANPDIGEFTKEDGEVVKARPTAQGQ